MVKKIKNKELLIKIICLLLSFGLWLYINNIENPVRERVIANIPVEILNPQVLSEYGLALTPNQTVSISLTVSGPAAEVYKLDKSQFRVVADLVSYGLKPGENNIPVLILNSPSGVNIKNNYPRVEIDLENLQKKTMPIYSEINVQKSSDTYVKDVKISPLSADIEGAESLVKEVSKLVVRGQVENINESKVLNLPIIPVNASGVEVQGVTVTPNQADVAINIEKGIPVPVNVSTTGTLPANLTLKSMTANITSVDIAGDNVSNIKSLATTPIDLSKITGNATIPVNIVVPKGVINLSGKNMVNVSIVVENNSLTKTVSLPINIIGQKEGFNYKLPQTTAQVTIMGNPNAFNNVDITKLTTDVDVAELTATGSVPIKLTTPLSEGLTATIKPESIQVDVTNIEEPPKPDPEKPTPPTPPANEGGTTEPTKPEQPSTDDSQTSRNTTGTNKDSDTSKNVTATKPSIQPIKPSSATASNENKKVN